MSLFQDVRLILRDSKRSVVALLSLLPVIYLLSGFYSVGAEQRGMVLRFGQVVQDDVMPGMHYHIPWPIEDVQKIRVTALRSLKIDFPADAPPSLQPELTTGESDLVDVALEIQYNVQEPARFYSTSHDPEQILKQVAISETVYYVGGKPIDSLLTTGRNQLQSKLRTALQASVRDLRLGLRVTSVQIARVEPPQPIKKAFDDVAWARAEKQKLIQEGKGERNTRLAQARSDANKLIADSRAYASEISERALGNYERFLVMLKEHQYEPELNRNRLYHETIERVLGNADITLVKPR